MFDHPEKTRGPPLKYSLDVRTKYTAHAPRGGKKLISHTNLQVTFCREQGDFQIGLKTDWERQEGKWRPALGFYCGQGVSQEWRFSYKGKDLLESNLLQSLKGRTLGLSCLIQKGRREGRGTGIESCQRALNHGWQFATPGL